MRQKGSMDTGKHKDRQSAVMKRGPVLFPPGGPSTSSRVPFKPRCTPLQRPGQQAHPTAASAAWLSPPRASSEDRVWRRTEAKGGFLWRGEVAEFKLSVISDFQQIRCCLELLSRLGRAKGRTCGHTFPPTPRVSGPDRPTHPEDR